jgi:hypothetical protein
VGTVAAHGLTAFLAGAARFFGIEFVRRAFLVRGLAAFARDFALLGLVHCCETALGRPLAAAATTLLRAAAGAARAFAAFLTCSHVDLLECPIRQRLEAASAA